ncbi:hypothetical protein [Herbaspirillum aquaticum]|uniref:hypothetical protein n=1 Tax=Herbaspirillum aquaticum TaxID=568783 RepID=UPI0024DE2F1C|nr:hypothetical protein [Herbaspirillum aquaticum]
MIQSKRRPERIALRVHKGCLVPADGISQQRLRARNYRLNDIVFAEIRKPRNPKFHRLAHQLGTILVENLDDFAGKNAHQALKKVQLDGNIACEESLAILPGVGVMQVLTPTSLAFDQMDELEFRDFMAAACAHISKKYWPGMSAEQIELMASVYVEPT